MFFFSKMPLNRNISLKSKWFLNNEFLTFWWLFYCKNIIFVVCGLDCCLVSFYGISTIVGHLMLMLYSYNEGCTWMKNDHNYFYKIITLTLYSWKGLKCLWFMRDTDGGRQDRLLFWLITSSLDHRMLCYLQNPTKHFCFLAEDAQSEAAEGSVPQRGALTDCKLALTLVFTATNTNWLNCCRHLHILFHNAPKLLIRSRDLLLIYSGASLIDRLIKGQYVTPYPVYIYI